MKDCANNRDAEQMQSIKRLEMYILQGFIDESPYRYSNLYVPSQYSVNILRALAQDKYGNFLRDWPRFSSTF